MTTPIALSHDRRERLPYAVSALMDARADLLAEVAGLDAQRRILLHRVQALEISLRVLEPQVKLADERYTLHWRGGRPVHIRGLTRCVLKALEFASEPLTNAEIAHIVMRDRGDNLDDRPFRSILKQRAGVCLRKLNIRGLVRRLEGERPRWVIADEAV